MSGCSYESQSVPACDLAGDLLLARRLFVRRFVVEWDYVVFARWLRAHGREVLPQWALPFVGFVACMHTGEGALGDGPSDDAVATTPSQKKGSAIPLAVAFGYQDGRVGAVTWVTAALGLSPRLVLTACSLVTAAVEAELENRGVRLMISPTERPSLVKFMRRRGWRVAHAANVLLWREVDAGNTEGTCEQGERAGSGSVERGGVA